MTRPDCIRWFTRIRVRSGKSARDVTPREDYIGVPNAERTSILAISLTNLITIMSYHHLSPTDFRDKYLDASDAEKVEMEKWASEQGGEYLDALHEAMNMEFDRIEELMDAGWNAQMQEQKAKERAARRQEIRSGEIPIEKSARALRRTVKRIEVLAKSGAPDVLIQSAALSVSERMTELAMNVEAQCTDESHE